MKNSKKKQIFLTLIAVLSLVLITVGVSYSLFTYSKTGVTDNIVKTGKINFLYTEVSGIGKGISLTDAFPISDEEGKLQTGEGKVFDFKITSTIEMNSSISYEVTARKKTGSTLANSAVKVYLTEVNGTEQELLLSKYSELDQTDKVDSSKFDERILYEGIVPANTSNYEKSFRLRMWVDENTDFTDGSMNDKTFTLTVNAYADGKVVTDNLDTTNTLDSITVSDCILDPAFNSATTEYSCKVPNSVSSVTVNAAATSSKSKVRGLGVKDLSAGKNTLPIRVIAEDGSEKIYNVNVTRKDVSEKVSIFGKIYQTTGDFPTLTTSSNNSQDDNGLYKSTDTNTGEPTYYFRGNVENNYVNFAGFIWRVVRINEDGTIRIVMQDGINNNSSYGFNSNYNSYTYMYYTNSDIAKPTLEDWYQINIGSKDDLASRVATGNYYCEQAKVKYLSRSNTENSNMILYSDYAPNFKCKADLYGKGIVNANIGLITYDEYIYSGGYVYPVISDSNSTYYASEYESHTMSPSGYYSAGELATNWSIKVYAGYSTVTNGFARLHMILRPVINLKSNVQISSGNGTKDNPFIVE